MRVPQQSTQMAKRETRMRASSDTLASVLAPAAGCWPPAASGQAAATRDDAASCAALAGKTIAPGTVIQSADYDCRTAARCGTTKVTVPFCRIVGVATPDRAIPISALKSGCRRPPPGTANSSGEGSGGSAGAISHRRHAAKRLKAGFATMSTDNGHVTDRRSPMAAANRPGRWDIRKRCWISPGARCICPLSRPRRSCATSMAKPPAILFRRLLARRPSRADGSQPLSGRL